MEKDKISRSDEDAKRCILDHLEKSISSFGSELKFFSPQLKLSGTTVRKEIANVVSYFKSNTPPGAKIAIQLPNSPWTAIYTLAAVLAGRVPCVLPAGMKIPTGEFSLLLCAEPGPTLPLGDFSEACMEREDIAVTFFTSGSEGATKQVNHSFESIKFLADTLTPELALSKESVGLITLPMSHVSANLLQFWPSLLAGMTIGFLATNWRPGILAETISGFNVSHLTITPYQLHIFSREIAMLGGKAMETVKRVSFAGDFVNKAHVALASELFPRATLTKGYGLTEAPRIAMISSEDPSFFGLSAGRVVPGVELNIHPESGEILVRGPNVGDRPKLKLKRDKNQFINTGDIGYLNEKGLLFLHGRKGEIFKYRDKWISSRKIEEKISAWPGSTRSCCLPRSCIDGKRPILFLQTDPSNLENLEKFLRTDLRDGEIPEDIYLMVALPHLENGKVDKVGLAKVGNFTDHVSLIAKKGKIRFWKIG